MGQNGTAISQPGLWRAICILAIGVTGFSVLGCGGLGTGYIPPAEVRNKIGFSFSSLDREGLTGTSSGKVPIHYEFCIPNVDSCRAKVLQIDTTLELQTRSPGRIGCKPGIQILCIGNTHQAAYRQVVYDLASLSYIERIERTFFE